MGEQRPEALWTARVEGARDVLHTFSTFQLLHYCLLHPLRDLMKLTVHPLSEGWIV